MAGLVGVISHDRAQPVPTQELTRLVQAYTALRGGTDADVSSAGEWARVARIDGEVPGRRDEGPSGWMHSAGAIHCDGELLSARPAELDGQFAAIRYDAATDEIAVLTDPFGMQTLYVCQRGARTYVSTSSAVLARHLRLPPDVAGLHLFLRAGYQFGPLTQWQGVERLDPATQVRFGLSGPRREIYWAPEVDPRVRRMGFRKSVDHCLEVALATLNRRVGAERCLWADLTGGFDSRLIAAMLRSLGVPFRTATGGEYTTDPDVSLAAKVAQVGAFEWRHDRMPDEWVIDDRLAREALAWGDGSLEVLQLGEVLWKKAQQAKSCGVVVTGGGGEHVSARPWVQEFLRAGHSREVNYDNLLRMRYLHSLDLSILREDPEPEVDAYFRAKLAERVKPYADELNTTKLDIIYAYKSTGHFGAYRSASEAVMRQEQPFYYRDFFAACFSVHHRWRNGHRLQRAMIERANPRVAEVPTTLGGPASRMRASNLHAFLPYYARAGRAAVRKVRRSSSEGGAEQDRSGARRSAAVHRLRAQGVLEPREMRSADLYDPAALEAFLRRAAAPGFSQATLLGRVITVEMLLRVVDAPAAG